MHELGEFHTGTMKIADLRAPRTGPSRGTAGELALKSHLFHAIFNRKPLFLYEVPLLRHQPPSGDGAHGIQRFRCTGNCVFSRIGIRPRWGCHSGGGMSA